MRKSNEQKSNDCPIVKMLKLVSAKWTVEVLREVAIRPTRTRQFLVHIPGLSMKCLQERLKVLESLGMITRIKYEDKVPRVEHHITDRGKRLLEIFVALKNLACELQGDDCICPMDLGSWENSPNNGSDAEAVDFICPARQESLGKGKSKAIFPWQEVSRKTNNGVE